MIGTYLSFTMAAAEVNLILGNMSDSGNSSRHNLLYLLQNFAHYSTSTCPDLYFYYLKKLVISFQDQLEVRNSPPSFLFMDQVPLPRLSLTPITSCDLPLSKTSINPEVNQVTLPKFRSTPVTSYELPWSTTNTSQEVDPEIDFLWTVKQELYFQSQEISKVTTKKKVSFTSNFDTRRKATIKREHKCRQCKANFRYIQNLRNHIIVCHNKDKCDKINLNCHISLSRIDHKEINLKSECKKYMQIDKMPFANMKNKQGIEVHPYHSVRRSKMQCKVKSKSC